MKRTGDEAAQDHRRKRKDKATAIEVVSQEGDEEEDGDNLQFEDEWEDEYEEEEVAAMDLDEDEDDNEDGDGDGEDDNIGEEGDNAGQTAVARVPVPFRLPEQGMDLAGDEDEDEEGQGEQDFQVFIPGRDRLEEGEVLDFDNSAYDMLHSLNVEWPCLSIDILPDKLGAQRKKFPMTAYVVAGTQADTPQNNKVMVMKMSQLCKTKHDDKGSDEEDSSDDDDDDENGEATEDSEPILETKGIKHHGGVNRIRATKVGEDTTLAATWSDTGKVHIWDLSHFVRGLDFPQHDKPPTGPLYTSGVHPTEGFALDWSPTSPGRLLTGDCRKFIHLWETHGQGSWSVGSQPYTGHTNSVEDLQWSPNEKDVFASCSVDKTIKIWDARRREKAVLSVNAHSSDVNVISWNRPAPHLMLSGCDDGTFSIWDLRNFKSGVPAAHFKWHTAPITSVSWHPSEESVLAVAGADDQITIWDLSLEQDTESTATAASASGTADPEVPPQLLFIHQGQKDVKELHWHKQIPGMVVSTAQSGINVFKTISV